MAIAGLAARFHGRAVERGALRDALEQAASGRPTITVVEGEAGIGKTRLLGEALDEARARGMQVLTGRADQLERTRPFGVLIDALGCRASSRDPRRAAIGALLAAPSAGGSGATTVTSDPGLRFQVVDAVLDLVEALADRGPLLIGLDDLQWADPSSLLTLGAMVRRVTHAPVAVVGCLRPAPRTEVLELALDAVHAAGARRLLLGELERDVVAEMVAEAVAAQPGRRLMAALSVAGGNPLFVTELLAAIIQEGVVHHVDGRAEACEIDLPASLRLTILRRLGDLHPHTLDALRPASVLGSRFSMTDLSTITEQSVLALSSVLATAFDARVLENDGDRVRFRHDLIRDAVYDDIPAGVRPALHREAGRRLARDGAPALQVAEHLALGATQGDAEALRWLTRAAREAAPGAPGVAAELLERAIALAEPTDPGRDQLVVERAVSLSWAGRGTDAEAACRALLGRDHDPAVDGPARTCLAHGLMARGRISDALAELDQVPLSTPADAVTAAVWGWTGMARLSLGDLDGAGVAARTARDVAVEVGDHVVTSLALNSLAVVEEYRGKFDAALRLVDDARRLADRSPGRVGHRYPVHVTRGHILVELDRLSDARATLRTGRGISEELGVRWPLPSYHIYLAVERFVAGAWDDALAEFETALALAEETGERYSLGFGHGVAGHIALHRGDLRRAGQAADAAADGQAAGGLAVCHWGTRVRALLLEARGAGPEAYTVLAGSWDECVRSGLAIEYPALGPDLIRLSLAMGERQRAEQVAAAVGDVAADQDVPSSTGAALRCRGLLAGDADILLAAVAAYERSPRPLELALTREDAAEHLLGNGSVNTALPLLDQALAAYESLDATRDVARIQARVRGLGVRRGQRGPRRRPPVGWASLTPTERDIVDLVAEGLANPQIGERLYVSRRTVQTHLAHVFAKLDISSRVQLAAEATRQAGKGKGSH